VSISPDGHQRRRHSLSGSKRWTFGLNGERHFPQPLATATRHLKFDPRRMVIDEGEHARAIYLIIEGAVLLSKLLQDGRRQIIEFLGPGEIFGVTDTLSHDVCVETLRPTLLMSYDRIRVEESSALQRLITERMISQICHLHDHAILLGRKSAKERVATFLVRLLPYGAEDECLWPKTDCACQVFVPVTRHEIADYLGLTLETVSRLFSELKRDGYLTYKRSNEITINDVRRLEHLAGTS
jgi:CRP-like cAMP-binding protein